MKTPTALLVCLLILCGLGACGGDDPETAESDFGELAPDEKTPPGIDPAVIADYEAAPVPDPTGFHGSDVQAAAEKRGLFKDVPEGKPENLAALLEAFVPARERAAANPGSTEGGPAGPSYVPTDAELVLAELGARIDAANRAADDETRAAARSRARIEGSIEIPTFRIVTVKVFGTGYVKVLEQTTQKIDLGT